MSFLKSRIAIESIEESKLEDDDAQVDTTVTDEEPVSNDDVEGDYTENDNQENESESEGDSEPEENAEDDTSEEDNETGEELNDEAEQARVEGEEIEADLDADEEIATESLELCSELNTVVDVANALEGVSDFMYASMKAGTYNPITSTFVNSQVNHHLARLNQKATAMVAMEADADPAAQAGVATQNRGTIRAMIDRMIEVAKSALDRVIAYVTERFTRIAGVIVRMRKRTQALTVHLKKDTTTIRDINSPRTASAIGINGKVGNLASSLDECTALINHFTSDHAYGYFKRLIEAANAKNDTSISVMNKCLKDLGTTWRHKLTKNLLEDPKWNTTDLLPGNYVFAAMVPSDVESLHDLKTTVKQVPIKEEVSGEIKGIEKSQAVAITDKIMRGLATIEKCRGSASIKEVEKGFSNLVSDAKKTNDKANSSVLRASFNAVIRLITASAAAPSVTFTAGWLRIASNYLDYLSSASSFGFVNVAINTTGDKYDQVSDAAKAKYEQAANATGAAYDKRLKPHVDRAGAALKPTADRVSAALEPVTSRARSGYNATVDKVSSGFDDLKGRVTSGANSVRARFNSK